MHDVFSRTLPLHTPTHTYAPSLYHLHTPSHSHTHFLIRTYTLPHSTHTHTLHTPTLYHTHTHIYTHTHTLPPTLPHTFTHPTATVVGCSVGCVGQLSPLFAYSLRRCLPRAWDPRSLQFMLNGPLYFGLLGSCLVAYI